MMSMKWSGQYCQEYLYLCWIKRNGEVNQVGMSRAEVSKEYNDLQDSLLGLSGVWWGEDSCMSFKGVSWDDSMLDAGKGV